MAQCRKCRVSGFFVSVSKVGLCQRCQVVYESDLFQRARIIQESIDLAASGKTLSTRLGRCDLVVEHASYLASEYERIGVRTITPTPSELVRNYTEGRDGIIEQEMEALVKKAVEKAALAGTSASRVNTLNGAILKVREAASNSANPRISQPYEARLARAAHVAKLQSYLSEAEKAYFKGNAKKAIDHYRDALFFVRTDQIPDSEQASLIADIENKIAKIESQR